MYLPFIDHLPLEHEACLHVWWTFLCIQVRLGVSLVGCLVGWVSRVGSMNMACWKMDHRNRWFRWFSYYIKPPFSAGMFHCHVWWHQRVPVSTNLQQKQAITTRNNQLTSCFCAPQLGMVKYGGAGFMRPSPQCGAATWVSGSIAKSMRIGRWLKRSLEISANQTWLENPPFIDGVHFKTSIGCSMIFQWKPISAPFFRLVDKGISS